MVLNPLNSVKKTLSVYESEKVKVLVTLCDLMDCIPQALPSMEFSRQEYWSEDSFPSLLQGIFLTQESNPGLLRCRQILYCLSHVCLYL